MSAAWLTEAANWYPWHAIGFVAAGILALYFTPIVRNAAASHDIVDAPDGSLKTQERPVAYLGGLAIFVPFLISLGLVSKTFPPVTLGLLLGASVVTLLGLIDDMKAITPLVKFLGQLLAAFVLLKAGVKIQIEVLPVWLSDTLTVLWIVGVTNAFNIIDVSDGLAAGVGAISLGFLFLVATQNGSPDFALLTLCLAGSLLGFLRYNFRPASIYLGDAGSMLIGFLIGGLAMLMSYADRNPIAVVAPVLILAVPLFDTAFVILLRWRQGLPVYRGSPDHFAVKLKQAGVPTGTIAIGAYLATALFGTAGVALMVLDSTQSIALITAVLTIILIAGILVARLPPAPTAEERPPHDAPSEPPGK